MFSVDNFYDTFSSNYGVDKTNNFLLVFQPHGTKCLHNLEIFGVDPFTVPRFADCTGIFGRIVMHDQEPFSLGYIDTYRHELAQAKNNFTFDNQSQRINAEKLIRNISKGISSIDLLKQVAFGTKHFTRQLPTIFCHSELNSDDIKSLQTSGIIPCYYWWHGMVARDWFRHWQHYHCLSIENKSQHHQRFLLYCRATDGTRSYRQSVLESCAGIQPRVRHDWQSKHNIDSGYSAKIDVQDAVCPIHLVAETLFATNKIYLTEKVFKPMVMSQAFVLFAPPGSLQYLKDYGFQTFDNCWDESYDTILDHDQRLQKVLQLIHDLDQKSATEFDSIYQRALPAIAHNRRRFYSQEFQGHLIAEMTQNINQALFEQNQRHEHCLDDKSSTNSDDVQSVLEHNSSPK